MSIQGGISWIIIAWMPTVMREQYNMKQGAAGLSALGFLYVSQTIGLLVGGYLSDRWSVKTPRSRILAPAYAILIASPAFFLTGWSHHISMTFISLSLWGLAMGFLGANQMPMICLTVDARYRATAMGILNGSTAVAGGLAIYAIGALRDAGLGIKLILTFAGCGVVLCAIFLLLVNLVAKRAEARAPVPAT
jgi:MFS family permease